MEILASVRGATVGFIYLPLLPTYVSGANSVKIVVHGGICFCSFH